VKRDETGVKTENQIGVQQLLKSLCKESDTF